MILFALLSVGPASCAAPRPAPPVTAPNPNGVPASGADQPIESAGRSVAAAFTCTGSPCPWGSTHTSQAIAWPAAAGPASRRLGYTVSPWIYLPASRANGMEITLRSGVATAYAGPLDAVNHRPLATIEPENPYTVMGLGPEEVLSVQGPAAFDYVLGRPRQAPPGEAGRPSVSGEVHHAVLSHWSCDIPDCKGNDWHGAVIPWPSWAAYQNNHRAGDQSRSAFSSSDEPLYPYMGPWADGCRVTVLSGVVLIIEWERGTDKWRETKLQPGQKHVIHLSPPENGAMLETVSNGTVFSVALENCHPKRVPR